MENEGNISNLHPLEITTLLQLDQKEAIRVDRLQQKLDFNLGQCNQVISWLEAKGLIEETGRDLETFYELTDLGREQRERGTPEERIVGLVEKSGPLSLPEAAQRLGLENKDAGSAYGQLARDGLMAMDAEKRIFIKDAGKRDRLAMLKQLLEQLDRDGRTPESDLNEGMRVLASSLSRKRGAAKGAIRTIEVEEVSYRFNEAAFGVREALKAAGVTGEEIGTLTPEILKSGKWRKRGFRGYNINVPASRVLLGRRNTYVEFIERLKDKLVALGFEEFDGPLVETEFWNGDALFMPQFHAARAIHDVYHMKSPTHAKEIQQPYLDNVAAAHEDGWTTGSLGWRYRFDRTFTRRLILRSQGTVLSAKQLTKARVPSKYFGCVRCFRYDQVDATHLSDFYQTEGIVLGEHVNLRTLLGLLKMFALEVAGSAVVKFVPSYFPFTEPSVEAHIKHPVVGWMELGGSGIFRPEVTKPLGIDVPVLAWGLGIDRMAMLSQGIDDIRDLFSQDIERVRLRVRRG